MNQTIFECLILYLKFTDNNQFPKILNDPYIFNKDILWTPIISKREILLLVFSVAHFNITKHMNSQIFVLGYIGSNILYGRLHNNKTQVAV